MLSAIYFWEQRPRLFKVSGLRAGRNEVPDILFSRWRCSAQSSLFVYWVHVELVYGVFSAPLHKNLAFGDAVLAFAGFSLLMFTLAMAKNRAVAQWKEWRRARREVPELAAN